MKLTAYRKRPNSSGALPKACCAGENPRTTSLSFSVRIASAKASSTHRFSSDMVSLFMMCFVHLMARSTCEIPQCASAGMVSNSTRSLSLKVCRQFL